MAQHTVEKIGGTSMSDYASVRDNIMLNSGNTGSPYQRIFVVSAYGGITDKLLEHKKTGESGVYALFANDDDDRMWENALANLRDSMATINARLFGENRRRQKANDFIFSRLDDVHRCLSDLQSLCRHGHFQMKEHLLTVREMLASLGEAHSAFNLAELLRQEDIDTTFVDLSGWNIEQAMSLDDFIKDAFKDIDVSTTLPIVTGYSHCKEGLMATFDRGYSEMTFSRIAVLTEAREAIIHKEYHLSSADPRLVGDDKVVPIGRTNYDVADQLANLGMEAIHPRAAKGLRQSGIPLRVKNTFEPEHYGTLITNDYVSETPCVEIIAGRKHVHALEIFDQDMSGYLETYDQLMTKQIQRFKVRTITKDTNANTITYFLDTNLKGIKRLTDAIQEQCPGAEITSRKIAIVSAIGSDMQVPGILAKTVGALADAKISILAMSQSMRQVDMQFMIDESKYELAVKSLHQCMIEPHNHEYAICAAE
jgi:aspartate kinase